MKKIKLFTYILILTGTISSCQKEYFKPPVLDPNVPVSFSNDLQPILTPKCASNGCHNKSVPPNLLKDASYDALWEGGFIDTLRPEESILMIKLNTNMPVGKLPPADINKFLVWMKQGAKLN